MKALKEWVVAVEALRRGDIVTVVRKGGILEEQFIVENREFLLFPTYFHPHKDLLQPAYHADLTAALAARQPSDRVVLSAFARVEDVLPIATVEQLRAISRHSIWTPEYLEERFHWREEQPLLALLLRVHTIRPQAVPIRTEYGGCRSWIDLVDEVSCEPSAPALSDGDFAIKERAVREVLAQPV